MGIKIPYTQDDINNASKEIKWAAQGYIKKIFKEGLVIKSGPFFLKKI